MFHSTFCGVFVQCLGKHGHGWWSDALGQPGLFCGLMACVTHNSAVRQSPTRKVPAEIRATSPLPRVRDVRYTFEVLPWHGGGEGNVPVSSAPRIPGAYVPEALAKVAVRTHATQGVGEMNQGPLVSCRGVSRTSLC